jgi:hypothetical protein
MRFAYTRAKFTEVFMLDRKSNLVPFSPNYVLPPCTKVAIQAGTVDHELDGKKFRCILLPGTKFEDAKWGWVPAGSLHSSTLMSREDADKFTGVKYGTYKDYNPKVVEWVNRHACPVCEGSRGDHKIVELAETRARAKELYKHIMVQIEHLRKKDNNDVQLAKMAKFSHMIGVLDVCTADFTRVFRFITLSGDTEQFTDGFFKFAAEFIRGSVGDKEFFVRSVPQVPINCQGNPIDFKNKYVPGDLVCAAPKLIQSAIRKYPQKLDRTSALPHYFLSLSEIYLRPSLDPSNVEGKEFYVGHTAESCDRCKDTVPLMLCGYDNPFKKQE